ncbi:MAG: Ig-like domain-containing protein [Planctomycetota bacterium]
MRNARRIFKTSPVRKYFIYLLVWCLVFNVSLPAALALESGDVTASSGVIGTTWGDHTIINTDHGAIIDWSNFNTDSGQSVTLNQYLGGELNSTSAVLNRISGGLPTEFNGALSANGRVFVVNPAGVIFGAGSTIDVTQLVASGLNMSNDAFNAVLADPANRMVFNDGSGEVHNLGTISADSVFLIGKKVINLGSIMAPGGLVVMAAGDSVFLGQDGSNVVVLIGTEPTDAVADVQNAGLVSADTGAIVLAAGDRFSRAISNVGTLAASAGTVTAHAARIENEGVINVNAIDGADGAISLIASEAVVIEKGSTTVADGGAILIDAPDLTIADGYIPAGVPDNTLYEKWVEERSAAGTDLELVASSTTNGNIIVQNISDGEITGGSGDIALRTTYDTGGIMFLPATDGGPVATAIHTTNGANVYMLAGEGGITIGDVITEVPSNDKAAEPGKIRLFTNNYGDIETGQLIVQGGSYDEVSVIASGDLKINGSVKTITNQVPSETKEVGQAQTCLVSVHGDVDIDGEIIVKAHGKIESTADIHIDAGENITVNLGPQQRIDASSHTSQDGPAQASVSIHAGKDIEGAGVISINGGGSSPIHVYAKSGGGAGTAEVYSSDDSADWDETDGDAHAVLEIEDDRTAECPECPMPPALEPPIPPIASADAATTHMSDPVGGNVLSNDTIPEGRDFMAILAAEPEHGELVSFDWETGEYVYQPDDGYVGTDTFQYIATDGKTYTQPITVTITMTNTLPVADGEAATTHMGLPVGGTIQDNIFDENGDPLETVLVADTLYGTLTLNPDGTYNYVPDDGYVGSDSFTFSVADGQIGAEPVQAKVTIAVTNTGPILTPDLATTDQGVPVVVDVLANDSDPDGDPLSLGVFTYEGAGTLVLNEDGTFIYTPAEGFSGEDSFVYSATDPAIGAEPAQATVTITVNPEVIVPVTPEPAPAAPLYVSAVPGLERVEFEVSGCPALVKWAASELQFDEKTMEIWVVNALASSRDIQPCDACARLRAAATILQDAGGNRIAALAQVVNEFASNTAPPTEEQMASIADAITRGAVTDSHYALAGQYLDALAEYVGVLNNQMNFSPVESVTFAADKYVAPIAEGETAGLATYIAARLAELGG